MLRNALITAVAATLMGGFVLALQGIAPEAQQPDMAAGADGEDTGGAEADRMARDQAQGQQLISGGRTAAPSGQMSRQAQPLQQAGPGTAMGMCGRMMSMMMGGMGGSGGGMNQSGQGVQADGRQAALQAELEQLRRELAELKKLQGASSTDKRRR